MARVVILPLEPDDTVTLRPGVDFSDPEQALPGCVKFRSKEFYQLVHETLAPIKKPPPSVEGGKGIED